MTDHFAGIRAAKAESWKAKQAKKRPDYKLYQGGPGSTPAGDKLEKFINDRLKETGRVPSLEEIRAHMGWKHRRSAAAAISNYRCRFPQAVLDALLPGRKW